MEVSRRRYRSLFSEVKSGVGESANSVSVSVSELGLEEGIAEEVDEVEGVEELELVAVSSSVFLTVVESDSVPA